MITDPDHPHATATTFDLPGYLAGVDPRLMAIPEGRRLLTRCDPFLFALTYLTGHLRGPDTDEEITYADCHFDWYRLMAQWATRPRGPRAWRHSIAAPRSSAKSTHWFTIAPLWAGAHQHVRFVAAFADSGTQAEMHLQTFRSELAHNGLLRQDYPDFCQAARKPTGRTVADNEGMYQCRSGFVFAARGADTATLGMKVGSIRPDVIILDDIEKHEAQYSLDQVVKRRGTILNAIFPLNERARVVVVGTTTRPGSIVHQLVQVATGEHPPTGDDHGWIAEERITPHHHKPIIDTPGGRRSIWPAKWPLSYLEAIEDTRSFALNFLCDPAEADGQYWRAEDFLHGIPGPVGGCYCFVDPPVTHNRRSDPAGIAIVGHLPHGAPGLRDILTERYKTDTATIDRLAARQRLTKGRPPPAVVVYHAEERRLTSRPLLRHVAATIAAFEARTGHPVRAVLCEANQGGDLWHLAAEHLGVPFHTYNAPPIPKDARIMLALDLYQAMRVYHATRLPAMERQAVAWPDTAHDDVIDAVSSAALALLVPRIMPTPSTIHPR